MMEEEEDLLGDLEIENYDVEGKSDEVESTAVSSVGKGIIVNNNSKSNTNNNNNNANSDRIGISSGRVEDDLDFGKGSRERIKMRAKATADDLNRLSEVPPPRPSGMTPSEAQKNISLILSLVGKCTAKTNIKQFFFLFHKKFYEVMGRNSGYQPYDFLATFLPEDSPILKLYNAQKFSDPDDKDLGKFVKKVLECLHSVAQDELLVSQVVANNQVNRNLPPWQARSALDEVVGNLREPPNKVQYYKLVEQMMNQSLLYMLRMQQV
jgi:hypothetical protein